MPAESYVMRGEKHMSLSYLIKETYRTLTRNINQFLLSSAVISICLLILGIFIVITVNVIKLTKSMTNQTEIYVFLTDEITNDPSPLLQRIATIAGIATVKFISKSEALQELQADLENDSLLVNVLGEDPIPASLRITLDPEYATPRDLTLIEEKLLRLPGITEVWSGKELLKQLSQVARTLFLLDIVILAIVTVSVIFIAFQTVENSIIRRSQEIEIMELVGASRFAIQFPFVLQGALQGLGGSLIALLLIFAIYRLIVTVLPAPYCPALLILLAMLIIGIILGIGGSFLALNRLPSSLSEKPQIRNR
ncbi:MAG: permease-like cell division protein FtsX [candidate division WOR-3 bacterium]